MKGSLSWKPARTSVGRPMTTVINGLRYHWREAGGGPLLLLLHGGAAHSGWFQWMMPRLATRYRVVAPDLRGNGRTGHADELHLGCLRRRRRGTGRSASRRRALLPGRPLLRRLHRHARRRPRPTPAGRAGRHGGPPPPAGAPTGSQCGPTRVEGRSATRPSPRSTRPPGLRATPGPAAGPRRDPRSRALPPGFAWRRLGDAIRRARPRPGGVPDLRVSREGSLPHARAARYSERAAQPDPVPADCRARCHTAASRSWPGLGHHFMVEDPDASCALLEGFFERVARSEAAPP